MAGGPEGSTRLSAIRYPLLSEPDHDLDLRLHPFRQRRKPTERDVVRADVAQLAGLQVVEMMMGRARGIVDRALRIEMDLPHQAALRKHVERVVHRRLRDALA